MKARADYEKAIEDGRLVTGRHPAPDAAAIREAALREAADHFSGLAALRKMWSAAEVENTILALIPKGGA